jgi:aconitate hydratase 2/2-methylisocitrate dehydratase
VADVIELIKNPPAGEAFLLDLLTHRVPPGVDDAAKVKASFLAAVAHGDIQVGLISKAAPPSCWAPWWAATTCTR